MYYAIVCFGPQLPGPKVFKSADEARHHLIQCERDTAGDGEYYSDPHSLYTARVYEYETRAAAERGNISDTTDDSRGQRTPGFIRQV